jgi:hypothetical protein
MPPRTLMIQPDPFRGRAEKVADYIPSILDTSEDRERRTDKKFADAMLPAQHAGRPLQGISVKPNTAAFAQVVQKDGKVRPVTNQLGVPIDPKTGKRVQSNLNGKPRNLVSHELAWTDWFLQTVREERSEKTQLLETFGETYLFAFGQKPRTLVFQGTLMNTLDFNWRAVFWENWDAEFRATQLIKHDARMYISWDDVLVEGYPINAVTHQVSDSPNAMVFSFTFFVTNYISLAAKRKWAGEKQQAIPLAHFRSRVPQDDNLEGMTRGQKIVRLTGLQGVRSVAGLAASEIAATNIPGSTILADLARSTVNYAGNLVAGLALSVDYTDYGAQSNALFAYETARFSREFAETLLYAGAKEAGFSPSSFNMWFGYAAALAKRAGDITLNEEDEDGEREFVAGLPDSVDELIQRLGYAVQQGALGVPGGTSTMKAPIPNNPSGPPGP